MIVNLTPHAVSIVAPNGDKTDLPATGTVARCNTTVVPVGTFGGVFGGVPLTRTTYGEVVGLPEPVEGTLYVVSGLVRAAVPERTDVASPGELVRDALGVVTGCRGLVVN